jgi:tRNA A-37 threonylcarbamoyl transferase component Bud32
MYTIITLIIILIVIYLFVNTEDNLNLFNHIQTVKLPKKGTILSRPDLLEVDTNLKYYINSLEDSVNALTVENNKLKLSNENTNIKGISDTLQNNQMNNNTLLQQQNLITTLEKHTSSHLHQPELVQVFDATYINQSELICDTPRNQIHMGQLTLPVAIKKSSRLNQEIRDKSDIAREISQEQKEEMIFREASLQGALRHPGIVNVYGISILQDNQIALITELVKGDSLEKILHFKKITLSIHEIIIIAIQLADILAYLHHHGVVHRDIKSGNIIVSDDMIVKLCDFDWACKLKGDNYNCKYVLKGGFLAILAPEILSNESNSITEFVDVYSFAFVCWEMCTGKRIWSEININEIENQVLSGKRPIIPSHVPTLFANMIKACWEQNPAHRPNFITILYMLQEMGGKLPLHNSHRNYFSSNLLNSNILSNIPVSPATLI